ncbi:MAG: zinc ABC transporter substrate-binding protein [Alphaproteobacteria bacterium]|nr:zinc ABC transporter substrate-binding protein [Alphaproteobacteria bacterium]
MIRFATLVLAAAIAAAGAFPARAAVDVFACEPEWAALATDIGGDRVEAFAATTVMQDPHHIRARPSLIARIRRADLLFCSGAGLEIGWLPVLLQRGAPAGVQPGRPGHLMAAEHVALLDKPAVLDRAQGDLHPEGNPHLHLDPRNLVTLAGVVAERLALLDPEGKAYYAARAEAFRATWNRAIAEWQTRARVFRDMPVIVQHKAWSYLVAWLELKEVAALEPKPGLPPTASHLESLLRLTRAQNVAAIFRAPYDSPQASEWLSSRAKIPALTLPYTVGADTRDGQGARTLHEVFERTVTLLETAAKRKAQP